MLYSITKVMICLAISNLNSKYEFCGPCPKHKYHKTFTKGSYMKETKIIKALKDKQDQYLLEFCFDDIVILAFR